MPIMVILGRLLLFVILAIAAVTKLYDRAGSRQALLDFGVPRFLSPWLAVCLPVAELLIGFSLLPVASVWWGALGAFLLFCFFSIGISVNLAYGRRPECHCFGQLASAPIGWRTLIRSLACAALAGFLVWQERSNSGPSIVGWLGDLTIPQRAGLIGGSFALLMLAAVIALLFQMMRQQGRILVRMDAIEARMAGTMVHSGERGSSPTAGLPIGKQAPDFSLDDVHGGTFTLKALLTEGKPALLLFTNPNCGPCQSLMPDVAFWKREYSATVNVVLVSEGTIEDNIAKMEAAEITRVLLQQKREVAEAYQVYGTPGAVLISPDGSIGSPVAQGLDAIRLLIAQTINRVSQPPTVAPVLPQNGRGNGNAIPRVIGIGDPAPSLKLPDLGGRTVAINMFRGSKTLLLFWNPGCGFCQQMLNDLRTWEADPPPGAPKLLIISTGRVEDNRAMRLRSTVLLDQNFQAARAFRAHGTPMAVLLDARGRVASGVASGSEAVWTLVDAGPLSRTNPVHKS